jgi:hypothetical protein
MAIHKNVKFRQTGTFEFVQVSKNEEKIKEGFFTKIFRQLSSK